VYEVDAIALLAREVLRRRAPELIAEACAWSVGLSDRPHHVRRHGRVTSTGLTLGMRAAADQHLGGEEDARLELADAPPGSFGDLLNALTPDAQLYADLLDEQVLTPFVLDTCVQAVQRSRAQEPAAYAELLEELDEDGSDPAELVRTAEWEAPLKTEAEQLLLAALAHVPLVEVEAEGLPLSLVRAAEAQTRAAAPERPADPTRADVSGALFLAEAALQEAALPLPVPPEAAPELLEALTAEGIEPDEVLVLLPHLPVLQDTAEQVARALAEEQGGPPPP
jgi:hypothetical protein